MTESAGQQVPMMLDLSKESWFSMKFLGLVGLQRAGMEGPCRALSLVGEEPRSRQNTAARHVWGNRIAGDIAVVDYHWLRDGKPIYGERANFYFLTPADAGKKISVQGIGIHKN